MGSQEQIYLCLFTILAVQGRRLLGSSARHTSCSIATRKLQRASSCYQDPAEGKSDPTVPLLEGDLNHRELTDTVGEEFNSSGEKEAPKPILLIIFLNIHVLF